jgi:alpha-glucosidase (family GH31 glycosyl hydrolase)
MLADNDGAQIVFLKGNYDLIRSRLSMRKDHYMKPQMLQSQFDTLEEPTNALTVEISRSVNQAMIEDGLVDLFVIGGRNIERILYNYRLLTGFPHDVPLWSYGIWMGRMTYFTAEETRQVAARLREESFPCDVIHVDTGWFDQDWICDTPRPWRISILPVKVE